MLIRVKFNFQLLSEGGGGVKRGLCVNECACDRKYGWMSALVAQMVCLIQTVCCRFHHFVLLITNRSDVTSIQCGKMNVNALNIKKVEKVPTLRPFLSFQVWK